MIDRKGLRGQIHSALGRSSVVALLGPRQCGKTTLARTFVPLDSLNYFDLENPQDLARLEQPEIALRELSGLVAIDEIQLRPNLFTSLRVLVDRPDLELQVLVLGSASPDLLRQSSQTLAGRIEYIEMTGFSLNEVGSEQYRELWDRGTFPRSYLAASSENSFIWRENFVKTFLERDLGLFGIGVEVAAMRRFWSMLAHVHGQIWNVAEIARSLGLHERTVRRYVDILTDLLMIRQLKPWHANLKKRQVKSPKIYLRDSGLLHTLLNIRDYASLLVNPKLGASWEGFAMEQTILCYKPDEVYFWSTHNQAELDLLMVKGAKRIGVEYKRQDGPKLTRSTKIALEDLELDELIIIYPGARAYPLDHRVTVEPISVLAEDRSG